MSSGKIPRFKKNLQKSTSNFKNSGKKSFNNFLPANEPQNYVKPELLAPAGSKASWAAAISAGADAVYVGLNDFSARAYADNFSLSDLKALIEVSHQEKVKVYVAFNSLLKEEEMAKAFKFLDLAASFNADAFIIQDLGLASLAKKYFPSIERHASTLIGAHSVPALVTLKDLGFSRGVLSRELNFEEIKAISLNSPIGVEIFIQGALCFSFSGLCLMSSFLGGRSALRGGCTQPCRRLYKHGSAQKAFFSTTDFNSSNYFKQLKTLPISSFKIEGRMKGPDYVYRAVKAYRLLLDQPLNQSEEQWNDVFKEAQSLLEQLPARKQSSGPMAKSAINAGLAPLHATTSGLKLGFFNLKEKNLAELTLENDLVIGDRLRIQGKLGEESSAFKAKKIFINSQSVDIAKKGDLVQIELDSSQSFLKGYIFKTASGVEEKDFLNSNLVKDLKRLSKNAAFRDNKKLPVTKTLVYGKNKKIIKENSEIWLWIDRVEQIKNMESVGAHKYIIPATVPNFRQLKNVKRKLNIKNIILSLPPLIFYKTQSIMVKELGSLINQGFNNFLISNIGQLNILKRMDNKDIRIWSDHRMAFLNHFHEEVLISSGLSGACLSLEADQKIYDDIWKAGLKGKLLIYFYGRPALFTSRYSLAGTKNLPFISPKGEKFRASEEGEQFILRPENPVVMNPVLKMPSLINGQVLIIDLRWEINPEKTAKAIKKSIFEARHLPGTAVNFKRGLI